MGHYASKWRILLCPDLCHPNTIIFQSYHRIANTLGFQTTYDLSRMLRLHLQGGECKRCIREIRYARAQS